MAWKRGYLYRNKRINGRVVTEYIGSGYQALLAEQLTERARREAERTRREWEAIKDDQQRLDQMVNDFSNLATAYADALLLVNGYRQHKRGEWRRKR